jgi:hypothetical protein
MAALLAGCGGAPTPQAALPQGEQQLRSWMAPGASKGTLVYAGGDAQSYVFSFPAGKLVGNIAGTSSGTCSDSQGDVFFTRVRSVVEFAHGGTTPIAIYNVPGNAYSCSVDPTTGNLAVVVFCLTGCGDDVDVFKGGATEPPKVYGDPALSSMLFCAYDSQGNLYVDGYSGSRFALAELPAGSSSYTSITLSQSIQYGGQLQWDGQYVTVETTINPAIYQIAVAGSAGTVVGTVRLKGVGLRATQSWIGNGRVAVPTGPFTKRAIEIIFWKYPQGGEPTNSFEHFIGKGHQQVVGVTFSVSPP